MDSSPVVFEAHLVIQLLVEVIDELLILGLLLVREGHGGRCRGVNHGSGFRILLLFRNSLFLYRDGLS